MRVLEEESIREQLEILEWCRNVGRDSFLQLSGMLDKKLRMTPGLIQVFSLLFSEILLLKDRSSRILYFCHDRPESSSQAMTKVQGC